MEASNLGAYLADKTDEQTELALKIIAEGMESTLLCAHWQGMMVMWNIN